MNDLIQDGLIARYPEILGSLADGIQCDDGWLDLLDALFDEITRHCMSVGIPLPRARQVKEKTALSVATSLRRTISSTAWFRWLRRSRGGSARYAGRQG